MRDLIGKLEVVDDDTASALRVIDHFDRLVDERASTAAVVRAAAALAGSPAGLHDAARGLVKRFAPDGRALTGGTEGSWHHAPIPGQAGSWLWLERAGDAGPLDALILERAARALQALSTGSSDPSTSGLVRIACDPDATDADRLDAVARLGLTGPVTVVLSTSVHLRATLLSTVGALVVALLPGTPTIPEGIRAGAAVATNPLQLPTALEQARTALRLAADVGGLAPAVVRYDAAPTSRSWTIRTRRALVRAPRLCPHDRGAERDRGPGCAARAPRRGRHPQRAVCADRSRPSSAARRTDPVRRRRAVRRHQTGAGQVPTLSRNRPMGGTPSYVGDFKRVTVADRDRISNSA